MADLLPDFLNSITLRGALLGILVFVITFLVNLAIVSFILVKLPANYFQESQTGDFWKGRPHIVRILGILGKNALGVLLVVLGILLSIPGVPGQGVLTILLGIMLLDFPGRHRLEHWLVSRPKIFKAINKLRHRFSKPALVLD
jgi:hypothetical protein